MMSEDRPGSTRRASISARTRPLSVTQAQKLDVSLNTTTVSIESEAVNKETSFTSQIITAKPSSKSNEQTKHQTSEPVKSALKYETKKEPFKTQTPSNNKIMKMFKKFRESSKTDKLLILFILITILCVIIIIGLGAGLGAKNSEQLGKTCRADTDCDTSKFFVCNNSICVCRTDYYYPSSNAPACVSQLTYNSPCKADTSDACLSKSSLSCQYVTSVSSYYCRCPLDYYWDSFSKNCVEQVGYNIRCYDADECKSSQLLSCLTDPIYQAYEKCQCSTGYFFSAVYDSCIKRLGYYEMCTDLNQCDNSIGLICGQPNSAPFTVCICSAGRYYDINTNKCLPQIGYNLTCSNPDQCLAVQSLVCIFADTPPYAGICNCTNGYFWANAYGSCIPIPKLGYNQTCINVTQCDDSLFLTCAFPSTPPSNGTGTCNCSSGFYWSYEFMSCVPQKSVDVMCNASIECSSLTGLTCVLNATMGYNTCQCNPDYYYGFDGCVAQSGYNATCYSSIECISSKNLFCLLDSTNSTLLCRCNAGKNWNGVLCA